MTTGVVAIGVVATEVGRTVTGVATGTPGMVLNPVAGTGAGVGIICVGWPGGHPRGKPVPPAP